MQGIVKKNMKTATGIRTPSAKADTSCQSTRIKLCGLMRPEDIIAVNKLNPDYIGFVFASFSRRYITLDTAKKLKASLAPEIKAVGVFVDEKLETVTDLANSGIIDMIQLHGKEDETYINTLRTLADNPVIKAFRIGSDEDVREAERSSADYILLDSGTGTGNKFDWGLLKNIKRPYFLAGGLNPENVTEAVETLRPFAVDVSSGIETDGVKDEQRMTDFVNKVSIINNAKGLLTPAS